MWAISLDSNFLQIYSSSDDFFFGGGILLLLAY